MISLLHPKPSNLFVPEDGLMCNINIFTWYYKKFTTGRRIAVAMKYLAQTYALSSPILEQLRNKIRLNKYISVSLRDDLIAKIAIRMAKVI